MRQRAYFKLGTDFTQARAGFTLIELLVVVAIIGLLASIILASLSTARQKGRDARRLSDLREMANTLELANIGIRAGTMTCTVGSAVSSCTAPSGLGSYNDPSGSATVCGKSGNGASTCNYVVELAGSTQSYEICAWLETASGPLSAAGMASITGVSSGTIISGCQ
jgi:prepilin-type N-terminal cleavage/methylation domain-containing protein